MAPRAFENGTPGFAPTQGAAAGGSVAATPKQQAADISSIGVSSTGAPAADDPPVYWQGPTGDVLSVNTGRQTARGDGTKTRSEALQQVFEWYGTPKYQELVDYLVKLGLVTASDATNIQKIAQVWGDAVDVSAALGPGKKIDPWNAAKLLQTSDVDGAASGQPKTQTSVSTNLTDPTTAKGLINNAMSQALGRAATEEEIAEFIDTLHAQQYANPNTSTTTYNEDGTSATTTSQGGVDPGQVAQDVAMSEDDYAEVQAGTTYFNALQSIIGG